MEPSIIVKHGHYHHVVQDSRHIWTVEFNPANGMYFITNKKTNIYYELLASQFASGPIGRNPVVSKFPGYVHMQVWSIHEYHYQVRRNK